MKSRDLIIKTARRLDKFDLDELIVVSELEEKEVTEILSELVKQQVVLKNNNTYFFNTKKSAEINNNKDIVKVNGIKPIVIEEEEGYEDFLKFGKETQNRVRAYIELFNEISDYPKISLSAFTRVRKKYSQYGFKGILSKFGKHITASIPDEIYNCFKKYYLTNEKLSGQEAIYRAQKELQAEQKIEQPYAYNSGAFFRRLKSEFKPEQVEYFRNNITPPKEKIEIKKEIKEPLGMFFKDAAKVYFNRLKSENKLERIMHQKTDYKNHLKEYFGDMRIRDIKNKEVAKFKQKKFDSGYQLVSVNNYILTLKNIINEVCPKTNYLTTRSKKLNENAYAMDMTLLSDEQILKLLDICHKRYPDTYPIFYVSLSTGASIPELLGLAWDRIDFETQTISLKYFLYGNKLIMNKCNSTMRNIKINNEICNILKDKFYEFQPAPEDFVFKFNTNKIAQLHIEEDALYPLSEELNISKLNPSDMQHNFVNMCLKQNIPLTFIQKSLGYYGIVNYIKTYKNLIETLEESNYNPLDKILGK